MICSEKCRLAKRECQGHGWYDDECMVSHELTEYGKECPYANKTIKEINKMEFRW